MLKARSPGEVERRGNKPCFSTLSVSFNPWDKIHTLVILPLLLLFPSVFVLTPGRFWVTEETRATMSTIYNSDASMKYQ